MEYNVVLRIKVRENSWIRIGEEHRILWETRGLIEASSGWTLLNQVGIGSAASLVPLFEKGIWELTQSADSYLSYEALFGMGTIRDTLEFYRNLLKDCKGHPYAELYGEVVA